MFIKSSPLVLLMMLGATAAIAGPSMTVSSLETKLSQEECLAVGSSIMRSTGLTKNFEVVGSTVFGETGDYTAAIRCDTVRSSVMFVTAGPSAKRTPEITNKLKAAFE